MATSPIRRAGGTRPRRRRGRPRGAPVAASRAANAASQRATSVGSASPARTSSSRAAHAGPRMPRGAGPVTVHPRYSTMSRPAARARSGSRSPMRGSLPWRWCQRTYRACRSDRLGRRRRDGGRRQVDVDEVDVAAGAHERREMVDDPLCGRAVVGEDVPQHGRVDRSRRQPRVLRPPVPHRTRRHLAAQPGRGEGGAGDGHRGRVGVDPDHVAGGPHDLGERDEHRAGPAADVRNARAGDDPGQRPQVALLGPGAGGHHPVAPQLVVGQAQRVGARRGRHAGEETAAAATDASVIATDVVQPTVRGARFADDRRPPTPLGTARL